MKIAFVIHSLRMGSGIAVVMYELSKHLAKEHDVTLFTFNSEYTDDFGVKIVEIPFPFKGKRFVNPGLVPLFPHKIMKIRKYLREYDVVNTQIYPANLIPLLPKKMDGVLHLLTEWSVADKPTHGYIGTVYRAAVEKAEIYASRHADEVIVSSNFVKQHVKQKSGVGATKMLLDGINFDLFDKNIVSSNDIYERHPQLEDSSIILYVGRIVPHKNIDILIKSLKIVKNEIKNAKLVIVGAMVDLKYYENLIRLIEIEELQNSVIFTGVVPWEDLPKYYATCDIFATCSQWEGFLRAEAFAMEKPMVAFDVTSHAETIRDGKTGLLVKEMSPEAFASSLINLFSDVKLSREMGKNGYKWAKENLDFDVIAKNFEGFIEEAILKRGGNEKVS